MKRKIISKRKNPDGIFGLFKSYTISDGYYLMFNKNYGPFIINKAKDKIFIYDNRKFKFYDNYPSDMLKNELKRGSIFLIPITDKKFSEYLNVVKSLSIKI